MTVSLDLDKPRNLRFDFQALKEMEQRLGGATIVDINQRLQHLSLHTLAVVLYVGLKHEDPTLTPQSLDKILQRHFQTKGALKTVITTVDKALAECGLLASADDDEAEVPGNGQTAATT